MKELLGMSGKMNSFMDKLKLVDSPADKVEDAKKTLDSCNSKPQEEQKKRLCSSPYSRPYSSTRARMKELPE